MATPNQEFFMRDYIGQTLDDASNAGIAESPDIIPYGTDITQPQSPEQVFLADSSSACGRNDPHCGQSVQFETPNLVYVRGQNIASSATSVTIALFYTESDLMLWPKNWHNEQIYYNNDPGSQSTVSQGTESNWVYMDSVAANTWAVTNPGFLWKAPLFQEGHSQWDHYCLIAFAQTGTPKPTQPKLDAQSFVTASDDLSFDQLWTLLRENPSMAWCNTVDIPPTETHTWTRIMNITGPSQASQITFQLIFDGYPTDGTFDLQIPSPPDPNNLTVQNYINASKLPITGTSSPSWNINWQANWKTQAILTYNQGATAPEPGVTVTLSALLKLGGGPPPHGHHGSVGGALETRYPTRELGAQDATPLRRICPDDCDRIFSLLEMEIQGMEMQGMEAYTWVEDRPAGMVGGSNDGGIYQTIGSVPFRLANA